jgi:homoserine O-acetyltransferase
MFFREIAFVTYRSGPEWDQRFGRKMIKNFDQPNLCPNFLIESYLDYQGEISSVNFDPNSLLYISKVSPVEP